MKNCPNQTGATTTAMPRSGCLISIARIARHSAIEIRLPGKPGFSFCSRTARRRRTAKVGLTNSEGCSDRPGRLIQRRAPLISTPITKVSREQRERDREHDERDPPDGARRQQRDPEHDRQRERHHPELALGEVQRVIAEPLGDRRARRHAHHRAEEHQQRSARPSVQRSTVHHQRAIGRRSMRANIMTASGRSDPATPRQARGRSPRTSKLGNWS